MTAPPNSGRPVLGKTLTELLYESAAKYQSPNAFNQKIEGVWKATSLDEFRVLSEEMAVGLRQLGLNREEKVAFFMESDVFFCLADMACLLAGLVDVPIYLSHGKEAIEYVIDHSEARALIVSDAARLHDLEPVLEDADQLEFIIAAQWSDTDEEPELPEGCSFWTMERIQEKGREALREAPDSIEKMRAVIRPDDVATLIYTSGTTGRPKGVILTHENISYDALTAFSGLEEMYRPGPDGEVAISFLPLTHIFARALHYGYLAYGTPVYFTHPDDLADDLKVVSPTLFASVPRVLEKVYANIEQKVNELSGLRRFLLQWALQLAGEYELGEEPSLLYNLQQPVVDLLVFSKWREALGGRLRYLIVGGAALNGNLANSFAAANIVSLQGYGLTETSPVIAYNRPSMNKAGTVGPPLPGLEVRIADDGEILTRGPHVMTGYYKEPEKTAKVLDDDGWFATGDIGDFDEDGYLRITDRKKDLFKLSTGKYVMPQPLESQLGMSGMIEQAVVVGVGRKFTGALIFTNPDALRSRGEAKGLDVDDREELRQLLQDPEVIAEYQELVDDANDGMDPWSQIQHFRLVPVVPTPENGLLTPTMKIKRREVCDRFADEIDAIYEDAEEARRTHAPA